MGVRVLENSPQDFGDGKTSPTLILAHGAGAPADSDFMELLSNALALEGVATVRFEFPYMERRREDGRKRPPDRQPMLLARFREVMSQVAEASGGPVFIGGKSMGGRMASLLAAEPELSGQLSGCVCFGYPFHPPGKPDRWRLGHFGHFCCPVMIVQGTRDPFGKRQEVDSCELFAMSDCKITWLEGANHDFQPLARQAETQESMIGSAALAASQFMTV